MLPCLSSISIVHPLRKPHSTPPLIQNLFLEDAFATGSPSTFSEANEGSSFTSRERDLMAVVKDETVVKVDNSHYFFSFRVTKGSNPREEEKDVLSYGLGASGLSSSFLV
ncbi:hypothetical protein VNO80_13279 [Phaseolus coccineus]|uniref:Uncharacterized protein n=1 Tax=Phaseolus coccineus TaxID=3886 RepID=A0AAN9N1C4_PHACN